MRRVAAGGSIISKNEVVFFGQISASAFWSCHCGQKFQTFSIFSKVPKLLFYENSNKVSQGANQRSPTTFFACTTRQPVARRARPGQLQLHNKFKTNMSTAYESNRFADNSKHPPTLPSLFYLLALINSLGFFSKRHPHSSFVLRKMGAKRATGMHRKW